MRYEVVESEALASTAAQQIATALRTIGGRGEPVSLAVSGGKTSIALFQALAKLPAPWAEVRLYFVDERCVGPDHPDSNFRLAREHLIEPLGLPAERVFRMEGEREDREQAARDYAAKLPAVLDVCVIGLGEDGHTASLFPGHPLLAAEAALRVATLADSPKPPPRRLTLTLPTLHAARALFGVAAGAGKRAAVRQLIAGEDIPAGRLDRTQWFLDRVAAGDLS